MPPWTFSAGRALLTLVRCKNIVLALFVALLGVVLLVSAWSLTGRSSLFHEGEYLMDFAEVCKLLNHFSDKELLMKVEHCGPLVRIKHALPNNSLSHSIKHNPTSPSVSNSSVLSSVLSQVEDNMNNEKTLQRLDTSVTLASVPHTTSAPVVTNLRPTTDAKSEHSHNHSLPVAEKIPLDDSSKEEVVVYLLAVMVISSPNEKDRRQAIRETWKKGYEAVDSSVTIRFVIGTWELPENEMESLRSEQAMYKDLVLLHNLKDDYRNLTQKVLYTLVWASEHLHFSYLLKCDDDTYVRVNAVLSELRRRRSTESLYWGYFTGRNRPLSQGKWAEHNWFLCDHFLPFAMGGGYIISSDLVHRVASNADGLQLYSNEDTSVGVWLSPYKAERKHDTRFNTEGISRGCSNKHILSHKQSPSDMRSKHHLLLATGSQCRREYSIKHPYQYNWQVPPSECCRKRSWV